MICCCSTDFTQNGKVATASRISSVSSAGRGYSRYGAGPSCLDNGFAKLQDRTISEHMRSIVPSDAAAVQLSENDNIGAIGWSSLGWTGLICRNALSRSSYGTRQPIVAFTPVETQPTM